MECIIEQKHYGFKIIINSPLGVQAVNSWLSSLELFLTNKTIKSGLLIDASRLSPLKPDMIKVFIFWQSKLHKTKTKLALALPDANSATELKKLNTGQPSDWLQYFDGSKLNWEKKAGEWLRQKPIKS